METPIDPRFTGIANLLGAAALERLSQSHICVIGLGGVGSWVVEGLARSGIGALTLVDLDDVCVTNVNRQLQALDTTLGRPKADVLAGRIREINPCCQVVVRRCFFSKSNAADILSPHYSFVIDAIDRVENKMELIAACVDRDLPLLVVGSGGERIDPLSIKVEDLAFTVYDSLLQCIRKQLRQKYSFPRGDKKRFAIPCVYAPKQRGERAPRCEQGPLTVKTCNEGLGSAVFMTASMGFVAVAEVVKRLGEGATTPVYPWKSKRWYQDRIADAKSV